MFSANNYSESVSKETVLDTISAEEIFNRYIGELIIGSPILSPLRTETRPSFCLYYTDENILKFKDFGSGDSGDAITFVMLKFNLSFQDALHKIKNDFTAIGNITSATATRPIKSTKTQIKKLANTEDKIITTVNKEFTKQELDYWLSYGITLPTLKEYKVNSVSYMFINNNLYLISTVTNPMFSYEVNHRFKIYRPLDPTRKWWSNLKGSDIFGYDQLPMWGNLLVITKSLKDIMLLRECGYNAIGPQSESQYNFLDNVTLLTLQKRFKHIVTLMDNDRAGINNSNKLYKQYGFKGYFISDTYCVFNKYDPKDPTDFYKLNGPEKTKDLLNSLFNKYGN